MSQSNHKLREATREFNQKPEGIRENRGNWLNGEQGKQSMRPGDAQEARQASVLMQGWHFSAAASHTRAVPPSLAMLPAVNTACSAGKMGQADILLAALAKGTRLSSIMCHLQRLGGS